MIVDLGDSSCNCPSFTVERANGLVAKIAGCPSLGYPRLHLLPSGKLLIVQPLYSGTPSSENQFHLN
jgi:hypothetical protein